jgi:hypothetical protein
MVWIVPALMAASNGVHAQSLEPRVYANVPVGMNFLVAGYQNSRGGLLFDPALPVTDADLKVDMGVLGYVRSVDVAGNTGKLGMILPYASLSGDGYLDGNYVTREQTGVADPQFYFSYNFYGAPALSVKEFSSYRQDTIIGVAFKVTAPLGVYQPEKLVNIGTNRWSFTPGIGISKTMGRWMAEFDTAVTLYTDNDEFDVDKTRQQDPVYSAQAHVIYTFPNQVWASLGTTYFTGGRTSVDGVTKNDLQQNWRTGFTVALPVDRNNSIKIYGSSGVSTRTGTDYDTFGILWQYRWGGGF